ncbi:MAG: hypothetical protein ACK4IK_05185 [Bacteroidia bacterium]
MNGIISFKYLLPLVSLTIYLLFFSIHLNNNEIIGFVIFGYILLRLIYNSGKEIPIKEILLVLLILQYFVAPSVVYNKFNNDVGDFGYEMKVDKEFYFSFLINSIIAISVGLYFPIFKTNIKTTELFNKINNLKDNFKIGILLLGIGFISHIFIPFFPSTFAFLAIFLTNLKYVGIFFIYFSNNPYRIVYIFLVLSYLVLNIISGGVFIDLFIWGLFIASYFILNKKISTAIKIAFLVFGAFTALLIQSIKADYRKEIWDDDNNEELNEEQVFINLTSAKLENASTIFEEDNLKSFYSRINQGWILSNVLEHVPKYQDFSNGEIFWRELQGIILPRIIAPNKITASGKDAKDKFIKYTGRLLHGNTTMNIGLIADGYINFGQIGCWIYLFFIGLFLNYVLYKINELCKNYPTLIFFIPILFFYVLRTGNDFYMIMNYLVKSSMLLAVFIYLFKQIFYKPEIEKN